jgi:aerobic carbon-monoxide dehydrogenase large subunit
VYVVYVRSTAAHGTIASIDVDEAAGMPGVLGMYTAADLGLEPMPSPFNPTVARTLLASDKVRYVGEPVVAVVAETYEQATDAAQTVFVDIDPLEALVDIEASLASETLIYESAGSNAVFDTTALGMPENTGPEFFADCEVVMSGTFLNQRVAPCPLEPRAAAAAWVDDRLLVWLSTQHAQGIKPGSQPPTASSPRVRVITPDVGGGFGAKIGTYSEEILLGVLARETGRPVRYRETRSESMMNLGHGRAQVQYVTAGGSRDGKVTHLPLELCSRTRAGSPTSARSSAPR